MGMNKIWRIWTYWKRGFGSWVSYLLSLVQFLIITYLEVQKVSVLEPVFPNLLQFSLIFVLTFFPTCAAIGYWDFKKGSYPTEASVSISATAYYTDIARALKLIAQGKNEEAIAVLSKWSEGK